jgi:hypothetical protein
MVFAAASAPFIKMPLHPDFLHPAPWKFIIELLGFVVFGVPFVVSLSSATRANGELQRPSWSLNPFQTAQPLVFFDFAAFTAAAYALGWAVAQMLGGKTNWFCEIPLIAGFGIWLGVRVSMFLFSSKLATTSQAQEGDVPNQLPDPTSPSVTPPAGAGGAPSVAADH